MASPTILQKQIAAFVADIADKNSVPTPLAMAALARQLERHVPSAPLTRNVFNHAASGYSTDYETVRKITTILDWLQKEEARGAAWLARRDAAGFIPKLRSKNLDHLYAAAQKGIRRHYAIAVAATSPKVVLAQGTSAEAIIKTTGLTPEALLEKLTEGLPQAGTALHISYTPGTRSLHFTLKNDYSRNKNFQFSRSIQMDRKSAYHGGAGVSDAWEKRGIAARSNANFIALYQALGVTRIGITAGHTGAYAWGRLGFVPEETRSWPLLKKDIGARLDALEAEPPREGPLSEVCVRFLRAMLASDDPKSLWAIVDQETPCNGSTLGKVLLIGNMWEGTLDLADPDCLTRINAYTSRKSQLLANFKKGPSYAVS
jgi:hypothetical protein